MNRTILLAALACLTIETRTVAALEFITPAPATIVAAGALVTVWLGPSQGEVLKSVSVGTSDGTVTAARAGSALGVFEAQVRIPKDAVGPEFVVAMADLEDGGLSAAHLELTVDPGALRQLTVRAPAVMSTIGEVQQVQVLGLFQDGVTRELTLADEGTTYATTNDAVLGVHPSGLIQARSKGVAQLVVTNKHVITGAIRSTGVTIRCDLSSPPTNQIPVPDAGADQAVGSETIVDLTGAASNDPDGDPLRFRWEQEQGRMVILRDSNTATPYFMAPRVTEEDILEFSLVVRDNKGATSLPKTVRITVKPR